MKKIIIFLLIFSYWINEVFWDYKKQKQIHISYDNLFIKWTKKPPKYIYLWLKNECIKQKAKEVKHCIKIWLAINYAESSFNSSDLWLQSKDKSFKYWVKQYKKFWYKWKEWGRFYWYNSKKPAETHYCMSEESSWSIWYCKNWRNNFNKIFFNIKI